MQKLRRLHIVTSAKGLNGGFALAQLPETLSLYLIADAIDDLSVSLSQCIFRELECSDLHNCPLHESWKKLREEQVQFLQTTTIADVVNSRER